MELNSNKFKDHGTVKISRLVCEKPCLDFYRWWRLPSFTGHSNHLWHLCIPELHPVNRYTRNMPLQSPWHLCIPVLSSTPLIVIPGICALARIWKAVVPKSQGFSITCLFLSISTQFSTRWKSNKQLMPLYSIHFRLRMPISHYCSWDNWWRDHAPLSPIAQFKSLSHYLGSTLEGIQISWMQGKPNLLKNLYGQLCQMIPFQYRYWWPSCGSWLSD